MQQILQGLEYSKSEAAVYVALLAHGPTSVGIIAKEAKISRIAVYDALKKLTHNGLVSYTLQIKKRVFRASHPSKIKALLEEKKKRITQDIETIPEMISLFQTAQHETSVSVYQGIEGLKVLFGECLSELKKGDEWLVLGVPQKAELLGGFFKDFNERRGNKKIKLKILFNKKATELIKIRKRQSFSEVRIMPEDYSTPASLDIVLDRVIITLYSTPFVCFSLVNKEVAHSFRQYFSLIWNKSRKV